MDFLHPTVTPPWPLNSLGLQKMESSPVYLLQHERFGSVRVLVSNGNAEYCVLTDACLVADVVTITGSCYGEFIIWNAYIIAYLLQ